MKTRLLIGVATLGWLTCASLSFAAEPYLQFVQGLRERQYYDYALLYLDQIAAKPNTPAEIKQVIPYQKAITLQESARRNRSADRQLEQLNQAEAFLEEFVKANPNHPNAADANSDRAVILLDKGRAEVMQSKSPANQGAKRDFQNRARETIAKARTVFQTASDQLEANIKKFPAFIDKEKDPEQYAARAKVEENLMTATLNLALCTYEEAQTFDPETNDFKTTLGKAAEEFEKIHTRYRTQVGGLYARARQGKCYEEQRDLNKALGIYDELLKHNADTGPLAGLMSQVTQFKLICLNSKERHDHLLVTTMAEEWLKKHAAEAGSDIGLGIQWEEARAYEALGDNRDLVKTEQERYWKQARTIGMQIQKSPSEYKDVATALVQRVQVKLGGKEKAPTDFATASGLARSLFSNSQEIKKELDVLISTKRPAEEIAKVRADWSNELNDAAHNFELAFALAKPSDDKKELMQSRLFYAYTNYWLHKNYEAAVLAQFVARTADKDDSALGLDAAYIAMAAFVQAYGESKAPIDQRGEDMQLIVKACNLVVDRWPSSDKANEALMILGKMLSAQKKPAEAAVQFGRIPPADPKYPDAQLAAGQAYWTAYLSSARMTGSDKPSADQLTSWQKSAEDHLRSGIQKMTETSPKGGESPAELIGAKLSLAQMLISQDKYPDALKLLSDDPHSVIKAVQIPDEKDRPEIGVKSRRFASETYKLIMRAHIGMQNTEKAREAMKTLEKIAEGGGAEGGDEILQLFVGLGKLLKEDLERLRANNETERFEKLMTSFETFLNDMASRKEGQSFGSLSWIGETYFALGESVAADATKSSAFFEKAGNAFTEILNRAAADQNFASPPQLFGVKLRQTYVLRLKKDFAPADVLMVDLLKQKPMDLKVQIAAAELYQDWGTSGQADGAKKLIPAIQGNTKQVPPGLMWGWGQIATKLRKSKEFPENPLYFENFLTASYNSSLCRYKFGREQSVKEKQTVLGGARTELVTTSAVTKDMPDEWYQKFNALYRDVLTEMGQTPSDLPKSKEVTYTPPPEPEKPKETTDETASKETGEKPKTEKEPTAPPPPAQSSEMMTWLVVLGTLAMVGGAVAWTLMKKPSKKGKSFGASSMTGPATFSGINVGDGPAPGPLVAPKPKPRPAAAAGAAGTKPATKPATKAAAPGTGTPKPKPKPPAPPPAG